MLGLVVDRLDEETHHVVFVDPADSLLAMSDGQGRQALRV